MAVAQTSPTTPTTPSTTANYAQTRAAAEAGDRDAQLTLAWMLHEGVGVQKDTVESAKWIRKAAEQGHHRAAAILAQALEYGDGVPVNLKEAFVWWRKAAEGGFADAQRQLGAKLYLGIHVKQNQAEGLKWTRKAAEQGDLRGEVGLALLLDEGTGIPQNKREALEWFSKAAAAGDAQSQNRLAGYYLAGEVVPRDVEKAREWVTKAAAQGYEPAKDNLRKFDTLAAQTGAADAPASDTGIVAQGNTPTDAEIIELTRQGIRDEALASIPGLYGKAEDIDSKFPLARMQSMGRLTAAEIAACGVNRPEDKQRCLTDLTVKWVAARDENVRNIKSSSFAADYKYTVLNKTSYEGNYVANVNVRLSGSDKTFRIKLLLKSVNGRWTRAEMQESELN